MRKKNEQLHLRDYGYSIKFPKKFRIRAIKKACKVFSDYEVMEHIRNISVYNKTLKEDLETITLNKQEQKELNTINAAYSLIDWSKNIETKIHKKWNIYDDGRISPVEEDVLNSTIIPLPPLSL